MRERLVDDVLVGGSSVDVVVVHSCYADLPTRNS